MGDALTLEKYSVGVGDRFARQAKAQLRACMMAAEQGVEVIPVWNKSNREHMTIGSQPAETRAAADGAVNALGWTKPYHVDADHIRNDTVGRFVESSDFFTIDVADYIGKCPPIPYAEDMFIARRQDLVGEHSIPGLDKPLTVTMADLEYVARNFIYAVREANIVYQSIIRRNPASPFITEISMDETDRPQTPAELLLILAAIAPYNIPLQTIAPKFSGRFNKGVDYVGDIAQFERE